MAGMTLSDDTIIAGEDDRAAVLRRYAEERRKRLRPNGLGQYMRLDGAFRYLAGDPFTPRTQREARIGHVDFAFIGGGFSGLVTGARLREAGVVGIRIIERGGDFGGTWYWNQYPGAQCDTASMVYLPLLEETGYRPRDKYAYGPEILDHCRRIGQHYDLYRDALFHTDVVGLEWLEPSSRWRIRTDRGDTFTAKYVGLGIGELHVPRLPRLPGLERFEGHVFHTSRWDYAYTGGDSYGAAMTGLISKRVGVVGTGATAVQCVSKLAQSAAELFVFQRTPSSVFPRHNQPIDADWFAGVATSGWQARWLENFSATRSEACLESDLVADGWTHMARRACERAGGSGAERSRLRAVQHEVDLEFMDAARRRIEETVRDRWVAERLKPWYGLFCKRPCFNDDYLPAFNRPNVHLVDTDGHGIAGFDQTGVLAGGRHVALDCLIFASGFEAWTPYWQRLGFDPVGRAGRQLSAEWRNGVRTLHGIHAHGFPNLFFIDPNQGGSLFSNITHNIVASAAAVAAAVRTVESNGSAIVEADADAVEAWTQMILRAGRRLGVEGCTPGRYNYEGQDLGQASELNAGYPDGAHAFFRHLSDWVAAGKLEGLSLW
jgi:cation diffusion facilitator CzcD-associated flavoprotein CzcO